MNSNIFALAELKQQAMNEATYYGKNEKLLKMEEIMGDIQREVIKSPLRFNSVKVSNKFKELENVIQDLFGFEEVYINRSCLIMYNIYHGGADINAFTFCHTAIYKKFKEIHSGGYVEVIPVGKNRKTVHLKDGNGYNFTAFISAGMFADHGEYTLTPEELTGILLHEIGHNFYYAPERETNAHILDCLLSAPLPMALAMMIAKPALFEFYMATDRLFSRTAIGDVAKIYINLASSVVSRLTTWFGLLQNISYVLATPVILLASISLSIVAILRFPVTMLNFDTEKYADAFATSYGYGPALTTALTKLEYSMRDPSSARTSLNKFVDNIGDILTFYMPFIMAIYDTHGSTATREYNMKEYLEDVSNKMDPDTLREYKKDLKTMMDNREAIASAIPKDAKEAVRKKQILAQNKSGNASFLDIFSDLGTGKKYNNLDF